MDNEPHAYITPRDIDAWFNVREGLFVIQGWQAKILGLPTRPAKGWLRRLEGMQIRREAYQALHRSLPKRKLSRAMLEAEQGVLVSEYPEPDQEDFTISGN